MTKYLILVTLLVLSACNQYKKARAFDEKEEKVNYREAADRLSQEILILDTHIDVPERLQSEWEDISGKTQKGHFDYIRAVEGGLNAPFMSIYIPASMQATGGAKAYADQLIDMVEGFEDKWPEKFSIARSMDDIIEDFKQGLISLPMGIENGAALEGDLNNVRYFYDRGIRYITLTHSRWNRICDSSYDPDKHWNGLSPFGREVVTQMNRLGMMIDISHVSDSTFYQVIELSRAPVIASHSSCRYFTPGFERNMSDEMIRKLAEKGGVIQISFGSYFLDGDFQEKMEAAYDYLDENHIEWGSQARKDYIKTYKQEQGVPVVTLDDLVDHITHAAAIVGVDHIGFGSDFDGVEEVPVGMEDVSKYPRLIERLMEDGFTEEDLLKICSGNLFRVWSDVNYVAENWEKIVASNQ